MEPTTGYEIYRDIGVAGLFIIMYLYTINAFIKNLQSSQTKANDMTAMCVKAIEAASSNTLQCINVMNAAKAMIEENTRQTREFIAFLKGRDDREG